MEEVKRRYKALAVRFGLRLGWQADIASSMSADGDGQLAVFDVM